MFCSSFIDESIARLCTNHWSGSGITASMHVPVRVCSGGSGNRWSHVPQKAPHQIGQGHNSAGPRL